MHSTRPPHVQVSGNCIIREHNTGCVCVDVHINVASTIVYWPDDSSVNITEYASEIDGNCLQYNNIVFVEIDTNIHVSKL